MDVVNLDIIFGQSLAGYTAKAVTDALGSTNAGLMRWADEQLFGSTSLGSALDTIDAVVNPPDSRGVLSSTGNGAAALPVGASPFCKALYMLQRDYRQGDAVEVVGSGLYAALPDEVRDLYSLVWGRVRSDPPLHLRLRLRFDAPELGMLPWEYIKIGDTFLGARNQQSLVRYP